LLLRSIDGEPRGIAPKVYICEETSPCLVLRRTRKARRRLTALTCDPLTDAQGPLCELALLSGLNAVGYRSGRKRLEVAACGKSEIDDYEKERTHIWPFPHPR
jgi:hypothetical protein